jgi:hypothetical protein
MLLPSCWLDLLLVFVFELFLLSCWFDLVCDFDLFFCVKAASLTFDDIMSLMRIQSDIEIPASDLKAALRELESEEVIARQGGEGRNPSYLIKQTLQ